MATEIHRRPVAETLPQGTGVHEAADVISGIMGRGAEPPAEPRQPPVAPQEPMETPDEVPDEPVEIREQAPDAPPTEEKETAPEVAPEPEASEGDAEEIELEPAQLAALLGTSESDLVINDDGALSFRAKVDGEVQAVALSDLRDSYQLKRTAEQRLSKLGEERKAFETERTEAIQRLNSQAEAMAQAIGIMEQEYQTEWKAEDWARLREEDPNQYALKRADYDDRKRRVDEYKSELQKKAQEVEYEAQVHLYQQRAAGAKKLDELFTSSEYAKAPKWDDSAKKALFEFMVQEGIPEQLLTTTPIWQAFRWARDSMLYRQTQKEAQKAMKKVVRLPKVTKPGAQKPKSEVKRTKLQEAKSRQKKAGGSVQATADRISAILRGS